MLKKTVCEYLKPILKGDPTLKNGSKPHYKRKFSDGDFEVRVNENVKRTTIPFGKDLLLLVSFEKNQDESQIMKKTLEIYIRIRLLINTSYQMSTINT